MPPFEPRDHRLAVAAFLVAWATLSYPWLSGAVTIPYDAKALFHAQLQFLANALHSGQSPFWNPSSFVGVPQIADPQSLIFSPAFLLACLSKAPSLRAFDALVLSLLGLGGLAVLEFCRERGWHPAGGVVAAIAFAFGGAAAWRIQHVAHIQSLAFFAVTLWLLARALDRSSPAWGGLAGVAGGLMVLAPNQVAYLGCLVLAGYVLAHTLSGAGWRAGLRASGRPLLAGGLVAAAIAFVPLLLTVLFLQASNRPHIALAEAARGSLHPASLLTVPLGDLFAAAHDVHDYWGPYSPAWNPDELTLSQNMSQMYIGTLPALLLLTVGVVRGALWAREVRVLTLAAAGLLLYALGTHTPVFGLLFHYLPGVSLFRRPVDAIFLAGALMAILAGHLVHLWASGRLPRAALRTRLLEGAVLLAVVAAGMAVAAGAGRLAIASEPLLLALGWGAAACAVLALPRLRPASSPALLVVAPALLLAADLGAGNGPNYSTALPPANYEILRPDSRNDTVLLLKERLRHAAGSPWRDRVEIVGVGFDWQNAALVHGWEGTLGYNPFRLGEVSQATGARDYIAGADQKQFSPLFPSYASMLADLLGLRLVVSGVPIEEVDRQLPPGALRLIARTADGYVYENPSALPRVLLVTDWMPADFAALVKSGRWPQGFDPRRAVLLAGRPEPDEAPAHEGAPAALSEARIQHYENTRVVVEVSAPRPGFLVLNDVWHPWWVADVDGKAVPIHRANVLFRAVRVPAGRHVVAFEFKPLAGALAELGRRLRAPFASTERGTPPAR